MQKALASTAAAALVATFSFPVQAQDNGQGIAPAPTVTEVAGEPVITQDSDSGAEWIGLLGLVGLLGLLGLRGRR